MGDTPYSGSMEPIKRMAPESSSEESSSSQPHISLPLKKLIKQSESQSEFGSDPNLSQTARAQNPDRGPERDDFEESMSKNRRTWITICWLFTIYLPDCLLSCFMDSEDRIQSFREKLTLFTFIILFGLYFGSYIIISKTVFKPYTSYRPLDIQNLGNSVSWAWIRGAILDMQKVMAIHPTSPLVILPRLGGDISDLFYTLPPELFPAKCGINLTQSVSYRNYVNASCTYKTTNMTYCHPYFYPQNSSYAIGDLVWLLSDLELLDRNQHYVVIHQRVYNTSQCFSTGCPFLDDQFNLIITTRDRADGTDLYDRTFQNPTYLDCWDALFLMGTIDTRTYIGEFLFNLIYTLSFVLICLMVVAKLIAALFTLGTILPKLKPRHTIIAITAYTEGHDALKATINKAVKMNYSNDHKMLFIICDGMVKGEGEDYHTPEIVLNILRSGDGVPDEVYKQNYVLPDNEAFTYSSLRGPNRAQVFQGIYCGVPYIVVVKVGNPNEAGTSKPGNRSKRDSQLIIMSLLNRVFYQRQATMSDLDRRLIRAFHEHDRTVDQYEYLMTLDADTRPDVDALLHLSYEMYTRRDVLACTGETRVFNKFGSWVTAIQVYSYFSGFALTKAFESCCGGSVSCLPGCLSLYRIRFQPKTAGGGKVKAGIIHDKIIRVYANRNVNSLHTKNLLNLGEDRMLSTLFHRYFPDKKLTYVGGAFCYTMVPDSFFVFMSQQRRWCNSAIHNMFELLSIPTSRGICCFSIKFVVLIDLISTFLLPSSLLYLGYLIYSLVGSNFAFPLVLVITLAVTFGAQIVIILARHQPEQIFWLLLYILALPLWVLIIPVYSIAHSDNFSWGATRRVADGSESNEGETKPKKDEKSDSSDEGKKKTKGKDKVPEEVDLEKGLPRGQPLDTPRPNS